MAAQSFTNFSGNPGTNQPTSYVAADGFVGTPATSNPNSPTFAAATFPSGIASGQTIHGAQMQASLALPVTATANTDLTESLPTGAIIGAMTVYTTTAYTAGTSATIQLGSASGGSQYVAATTISSVGVVALTPVNAAAASLLSLPAGTPNIFARIVQAGTATNVGNGKLVINYTVPQGGDVPEFQLAGGLEGRPRLNLPAIRMVNCFLEASPGGPTSMVRTSRPGFVSHVTAGDGPILRQFQKPGLFDGDLFSVSGGGLYRTDAPTALPPASQFLGAVPYSAAPRFAAEQQFLALVVGGALFVYDGVTLTPVLFFDDGVSALPPFSSVAVLYNIWVYTVTGSNQFYFSSVGNPAVINAANFSSAQVSPTPIVEVAVLAEELYFFKPDGSTEIWDFTGDLTAPFAESPGRTYTRGCAAQNSVTLTDNSLFWVGDDFSIYRTGAVPTRLTETTSYVEDRLKTMGTTISSLMAMTFNLEGHVWYVLNLPTLNESYAYDCQTKQWFIWGTQQPNQMEPGIWLPQTCAGQGERIYFGSSVDGRIFQALPNHHSDDGTPIRVVIAGAFWMGEDKKRMGNMTLHGVRGIATNQVPDPICWMRYSDDGGRTWSSWLKGLLGMIGGYRFKVSWHSLGLMTQPGRLMEFAINDSVNVTIEGAAFNVGRR